MKNKLLKLLHRFYRKDDFINSFLDGNQVILSNVNTVLQRLINLLHFNRLDEKGCQFWENLLKLTPLITQTLDDRRSMIRAKWVSNNHNNIALIQRVCDMWKNGETEVNFVNGKIQIKFVGAYGIPEDLDSLLKAIEEVKLAHLSYELIYKFLFKKDIHEVLTKTEIESYLKSIYCEVGV